MTKPHQKLGIKDLRANKDELIHLYNVEQKTSTEIINMLHEEGYEINESTARRFFTEVREELIEQTRYNDSVHVLDTVKEKIIAELDKGTSLSTLSTKSEELLGVKVSRPSLTRYVKLIDYKFKTSVIDRFMQYSDEVEQLLNTMRGKALIEYMNEKYNETFTEKTLVMYKKRVKSKTYTQRQKEWVEANADYLIDLRVNQLKSLHEILAIINANNAIEIKEGLLYNFYISRGIENKQDVWHAKADTKRRCKMSNRQ